MERIWIIWNYSFGKIEKRRKQAGFENNWNTNWHKNSLLILIRWGSEVLWNMLQPLLLPQPMLNAINQFHDQKLKFYETKIIKI